MADGSVTIDSNLNNKELKGQLQQLDGIIKKGMKSALVSIGAVVTAIGGLGATAVKFGTEYKKASNQIQASTGATAEEMNVLKDVMKNVYADNFGESMEDVADAVALVKQQLGYFETQAELEQATKQAIALRDVFGYDLNESIRAASAMMTHFSMNSEEAFNLITQGAQSGLDYSGELLDNISEYSVQFAKVGLDAQDMFDIFQAGATTGAWNLDKIGDAVKEFSIRAIDGSNTTIDGFTRLGLNANVMAQKFAQGGDVAKDAFFEVIQKIGAMDDKVQQSIVGVDLFGTMWEDLGPEVVTQLGAMRGSFDQAKNSAEQLTQIKYDDMGSAFVGIGRQIQTGLLLPISDKVLPAFNTFGNKLNELLNSASINESINSISASIGNFANKIAETAVQWLPQLINVLSWVIDNGATIIGVLVGIGAALKVFEIVNTVSSFIKIMKEFEMVTKLASVAQWLLNAAMNANPIMIIVTLIAALVRRNNVLMEYERGF